MKVAKKAVVVLCVLVMGGLPLKAQKREASGIILDVGGNALVPLSMPTGMGGSLGIGYSGRDFNLMFRSQVLIAEPGGTQKLMLIPTAHFEVKIGLLPGFLTLLPYASAGIISTKLKRIDGTLGTSLVTALYAEGGVGAELMLTHEISFIPRVGVAHALLYELPDSNNNSGLTMSASVRYTFGRSKALDY